MKFACFSHAHLQGNWTVQTGQQLLQQMTGQSRHQQPERPGKDKY